MSDEIKPGSLDKIEEHLALFEWAGLHEVVITEVTELGETNEVEID